MKCAIVYSSKTGNTRELAEVLRSCIPQEDLLYLGKPDESALRAERICAGFWTDKGSCDEETAKCFIDWIQEMNDSMEIPRHFPQIRRKDIPVMARHADKEGNPLYPVPVLMNRKELERIYEEVKGR